MCRCAFFIYIYMTTLCVVYNLMCGLFCLVIHDLHWIFQLWYSYSNIWYIIVDSKWHDFWLNNTIGPKQLSWFLRKTACWKKYISTELHCLQNHAFTIAFLRQMNDLDADQRVSCWHHFAAQPFGIDRNSHTHRVTNSAVILWESVLLTSPLKK